MVCPVSIANPLARAVAVLVILYSLQATGWTQQPGAPGDAAPARQETTGTLPPSRMNNGFFPYSSVSTSIAAMLPGRLGGIT